MAAKRKAFENENARPMGQFEQYLYPDSNMKEYYDEFEGAGPAERAELYRCRNIERRLDMVGYAEGPDDDWEQE